MAVAMSALDRTVSMTRAGISMVASVSVGGAVAGAVVGGGVEGLPPKKDMTDAERRTEDAGEPRAPGRGGRGGLVALQGSGSAGLNAETVNEG